MHNAAVAPGVVEAGQVVHQQIVEDIYMSRVGFVVSAILLVGLSGLDRPALAQSTRRSNAALIAAGWRRGPTRQEALAQEFKALFSGIVLDSAAQSRAVMTIRRALSAYWSIDRNLSDADKQGARIFAEQDAQLRLLLVRPSDIAQFDTNVKRWLPKRLSSEKP